ncbi:MULTISPECIES: class I SAM-dependent methyltransferase [Enterocloster]|uniref:Methyltransferase domain-containing protein n=1 Tax=Enterocloster lavalensis TaxID=460384 RepID=A0A1I0KEE9_9FIRM|nr:MULTISPECIES: class I SAM-dependent methyltransferase [Enterocloster]MDR3757078.1 class I SAM-dependent methyltransferase [Enterocloster sp.]PST29744.1 methyltransferase domain-containing protein [Enterocloster lavalensis]SEU22549.1 Methyltransferase domain-containing protein [Enterocloster lavalensis]
MDDTLQYYNQHAKAYVDSTRDVEFSQTQERFLQYLEPGARILDFGCGSGRDTKYFRNRGFQVEAVDGSAEFVRIASEYTGINVRRMLFQDLDEVECYDGIWACSSILHLPCAELEVVLGKMARALRRRGIVYTSFKYGTEEGERSGRYFTNMTEAKMAGLLERIPVYDVEEMWVTFDVRPGRGDERWLNMILRKR